VTTIGKVVVCQEGLPPIKRNWFKNHKNRVVFRIPCYRGKKRLKPDDNDYDADDDADNK